MSKATEDTAPKRFVSFLAGDPDKAHDKKVAGLQIDSSVTAEKVSLRSLRATLEATAKYYQKYCEQPKKMGSWALLLPELAEWSEHDAFCGARGESGASETVFRDVARLAAIGGLVREARGKIGEVAVAELRNAATLAAACVADIHAFELQVRDAAAEHGEASKGLKRATAAREAAAADERKAQRLKDDKKRAVGARGFHACLY